MGLEACKECGSEISTKAAACPRCGARRVKKFSLVRALALLVLGIVAMGSAIWFLEPASFYRVLTTYGLLTPKDAPTSAATWCTSSKASEAFKSTFDNSQFARSLYLTAEIVKNKRFVSKVDDGTEFGKRFKCRATLVLNNTKDMTFEFTIEPRDNGGAYVSARPIKP